MKNETIYTVSTESNVIIRKSRTYLSALEFSATLKPGSSYLCTSKFDLKKGQFISGIKDFLGES